MNFFLFQKLRSFSVLGLITDIKYYYILCNYYEHIIMLYNLILSLSFLFLFLFLSFY